MKSEYGCRELAKRLGLERYEPAFRENRIDADLLPKLTVEDLKDLGITLVGDRRRLLEAIWALRDHDGETELAAPPVPNFGWRHRMLSAGRSRSCSVISWTRPRSLHGSTPKICARSSQHFSARLRRRQGFSQVSSPDTWATARSLLRVSARAGNRFRTGRASRFGAGASGRSIEASGVDCGCALGSRPGWW